MDSKTELPTVEMPAATATIVPPAENETPPTLTAEGGNYVKIPLPPELKPVPGETPAESTEVIPAVIDQPQTQVESTGTTMQPIETTPVVPTTAVETTSAAPEQPAPETETPTVVAAMPESDTPTAAPLPESPTPVPEGIDVTTPAASDASVQTELPAESPEPTTETLPPVAEAASPVNPSEADAGTPVAPTSEAGEPVPAVEAQGQVPQPEAQPVQPDAGSGEVPNTPAPETETAPAAEHQPPTPEMERVQASGIELRARTIGGILADTAPSQQYMLKLQRTSETATDQRPDASEAYDVAQAVNRTKDLLGNYAKEMDADAKDELKQQLLSTCHEADFGGNLAELAEGLSETERNTLLELTRTDAVQKLSNVFDEKTSVAETKQIATEAWRTHLHLFDADQDLKLEGAFAGMPEEFRGLLKMMKKSYAVENEIKRAGWETVAETVKKHPDWAKSAWDAFIKYVLPIIKG